MIYHERYVDSRTWRVYAGGGRGYRRSGRSVIFSIAWTIDMTGYFNQSYFCTIDGPLKNSPLFEYCKVFSWIISLTYLRYDICPNRTVQLLAIAMVVPYRHRWHSHLITTIYRYILSENGTFLHSIIYQTLRKTKKFLKKLKVKTRTCTQDFFIQRLPLI